ncbi:methyltransferase domain-containing protein [Colwelliaceae bacterium 6441]
MNKRFLFQCNANVQSGLGHLIRCINIAKGLKSLSSEIAIIFCGDFNDFAISLLCDNNWAYQSAELTDLTKADTLIVDNYDTLQTDINGYRNKAGVLIVIDDFNLLDFSDVDLVINMRFNAEKEIYSSKQSCLGLNYFPFNPSLVNIRDKNLVKEYCDFNHIFVFIGGSDKNNTGSKLISLIDQLVHFKKIYLIDSQTTTSRSLKSKNNQIVYLPLSKKSEEYYQQADIFISGGGGSKYEAGFCQIPNATISQTIEQADDTKILAKNNLTFDLGIITDIDDNPEKVKALLTSFFEIKTRQLIIRHCHEAFHRDSLSNLSKQILSLTDGVSFTQKQVEWEQQARSTSDLKQQVCRPFDDGSWHLLIEDIQDKLHLVPQLNEMLDVGCGNGLLLSKFSQFFEQLYGVDYGQSMVENARATLPNAIISASEAAALPFEDEKFERLLSYSIFHYFPNENYVYNVIDEMIRVTKVGGVILIGDLLDKTFEDEIKSHSDMEYEKNIPLIFRYSNWLFCDLQKIICYIERKGLKAELLAQPKNFKLSHYRKDIRIWR